MTRAHRQDLASRQLALATIKTIHTAAWLSIESCMLYVLCAGFKGQSGKPAGPDWRSISRLISLFEIDLRR
jgi:hypothetical protein